MARPESLRAMPLVTDDAATAQLDDISFSGLAYTASNSPYLQGTEIVQFKQLLNYTNLKIRVNTTPVIALSGSSQGWQMSGDSHHSYDDTYSPDNLGTLIARSVDTYTLGINPVLSVAGKSQYITFTTSGSKGFLFSGSLKSTVGALETKDRFDTYISHYAEQRDLGQTSIYDDGNPFEEPDIIEHSPEILLSKLPENIIVPTSFVQASSTPASFDGVIEVQDIRKIADRSSIDLPFILKSPKGSLSVSDDNLRSYMMEDMYDLRQIGTSLAAKPYLDYVSTFGSASLLDQPGAFSDAEEKLSAFSDTTRLESTYISGSVDTHIRHLFLSGILSGTSQRFTPAIEYFPTYFISARHGFVFSQNDNYGYDSIAFGGLKK